MGTLICVFVALNLAVEILGITNNLPRPTLATERDLLTGFSPKPTAKAPGAVGLDSLFQRQEALATCAFYSGQSLGAWNGVCG